MLSKKAKYAFKALLALGREPKGTPVLISDLARRESIPKKFLELILLDLKHQGIVQSKMGKGGGYFLLHSPKEVSFARVIRILDGPLAPVPCASETGYMRCEECADERTCGVRLVMKQVRDATAEILERTTLADVLDRIPQGEASAKRGARRGG